MSESRTDYEIGPFRMVGAEYRLLKDGESIELPIKSFELLYLLVKNNGRVLTRKELIGKLWPGFSIKTNNLDQAISDIRKALGDYGRQYIRTAPGQGYLFRGPVRDVSGPAVEEMPVEADAGAAPLTPDARKQHTASDLAASRELVERVRRIPDLLPEDAGGISWLIVNAVVEDWESNLRELATEGMVLPSLVLMDCVVKLFETAGDMTVIDARCYDPREEWNQYWADWLKSTRDMPHAARKEYYMLYTGRLRDQEAENLIAAKEIMDEAGFDFYVCNRKYLVDYFGSRLPYFDALNIFGELVLRKKILKNQEPEMSVFSGGYPLRFWLHDKRKEKLYAQIHRVVRDARKEVSQDLIDSLR